MTTIPAGRDRPSLRLDRRLERYEHGRVLLDPRAGRILRLSEAGAAGLDRLLEDGPVTAAEEALASRLVRAGLAHPRPAPGPSAPGLGALVSVVVPVRDRPGPLERCLAAVRAGGPVGLEVVVVDDGSKEPAATAAVCARHGARLVRLEASRGPAGARNAALGLVERDLVAFLDSDCRPTPGWLEPLVGLLADPEVAAAAPRVRPSAGDASWLTAYEAGRSPLDMGTEPAEVRRGGRVSYVPSAALLVRRSRLGDGFDEALRYGEDVDLVWRLLESGARVRYEPACVVEHDEPTALGRLLSRRFRYGTSAGPLARRHPGALAPLELRPWPASAAFAALAGAPGTALLLVGLSSIRLARVLAPQGIPARRAGRLVAMGALDTGEAVGRAASMLALPLLVLAATRGARRTRLAAVALGVLPPLLDWRRRRPGLDPLRWAAASILDDAAYGLGLWWGAVAAGTAEPLVPRLAPRPVLRSGPDAAGAGRSLRRSSRRRWQGWPR